MIIYKAPFYNVYRINHNTKNEYFIIDTRNEYTEESVPNIPFNRNKSGIDNIIKYKNKYLGNNSNTSNLINNLPLSEYGYTLELDYINLGIIINYHITDWYINEDYYLEKSLIYNSVSIFSLIENTKYIKFNFSGVTYFITREEVEEIFTVPLKFFMETEPDKYDTVWKVVQSDDFPYERIEGGKDYPFSKGKTTQLFYEYTGHTIWGFTAQVIQNIIEILKTTKI